MHFLTTTEDHYLRSPGDQGGHLQPLATGKKVNNMSIRTVWAKSAHAPRDKSSACARL